MTFNSQQFIAELETYVKRHLSFAEDLNNLPISTLQIKPNRSSWSVLECIEHLNLYAEFYNPEIKNKIDISKFKTTPIFKSGFLGNKFSLDMLPKEGMKTRKTFKSKNPIHSDLNKKQVLNSFINYQQELLVLLDSAKNTDLNKVKTSLTIPLLKFRLGDTFRFVIYHNERHIIQAKNIL